MDASRQLTTVPDREPLSEGEAIRIGETATRLARLRLMLKEAKLSGGNLVAGHGPMSKGVYLPSLDLQAAIALQMERDKLFLASFNVAVDTSA